MEKMQKDPNADRHCVNCKYYDLITNLQQQSQVSICRIEPPKMLAQMIAAPQRDQTTGQMIQVPQWVPFSAWPIIGPHDWCGRFTRQLHSVPDNRTVEQKETTHG